jgi:uncharacterized protein (DUF488 family)
MNPVYTIGHSKHTIEKLVELLRNAGITAVADVRSQPYSRLYPHFNREALTKSLRAEKLAYVYLGEELGARTEDRSCYSNGQVQYDRLAQTALFKRGLERIKTGAAQHRIALLCAEQDPLACHRTILVGQALLKAGVALKHIRANGTIEDHSAAVARLILETGLQPVELFRSREEIEKDAFSRRAREIAWRDESQAEMEAI